MADITLKSINLEEYKNKIQQLREEMSTLSTTTQEFADKQQELADVTNQLNSEIQNSAPTARELRGAMSELKQEWADAQSEAERGAIATQIGLVEGQLKTLNQEMKNTSQSASAAEGSYNQLQVQMRELMQQAKATGDATERMNLSLQANEINEKLKAMDAEMGNYQRNVGSYENAISNSFSSILGGLQGVAGGTSKLTGAMNKLVPGLGAGAGALKAFGKALGAIKMGSWITAIIAAGVALYNWVKSVKQAEAEHKQFVKSLTDIKEKSADYAAREQINAKILFESAMKAAEGTTEYKNAVLEMQRLYPAYYANLSTESKNIRLLQDDYNKLSEDIMKAAKARAAQDLYTENYREILKLEQEEDELRKKMRSVTYDAFRWGDLIGAEREEQKQLNENIKKAGEYRQANAKLEEKILENQVDVHRGIKDEVKTTAAHTGKIVTEEEKRKKLLDEIEKKYKSIYEELALQAQENETYNKGRDVYVENLRIANEKRKTQLQEINEKYQRGVITLEEYKRLVRGVAIEWQGVANEYDDYMKKFKGEMPKIPSLSELFNPKKEEEKSFAERMSDAEKNIKTFVDNSINNFQKLQQAGLAVGGAINNLNPFADPAGTLQDIKNIEDEINRIESEGGRVDPVAKQKLKQKKIIAGVTETALAISNLTSTVADAWKNTVQAQLDAGEITEEEAEKQFERIKAMEIASAVVNTIAGAIGAYMQDKKAYPAPYGAIIGAADAAATLATGYAQVQQIKAQTIGGSSSAPTITVSNATPLLDEAQDVNQLNTISTAVGSTENDNRVYILQKDITDSNKQVEVRQSQSTF